MVGVLAPVAAPPAEEQGLWSGEVCITTTGLNVLARVPLAGMLSKLLSGVGVGKACRVDCSASSTHQPTGLLYASGPPLSAGGSTRLVKALRDSRRIRIAQ